MSADSERPSPASRPTPEPRPSRAAGPRSTPPRRASAATSASIATEAPTQIDRYRVIRHIGAGGMGTVYLAEDPTLHRTVALKVLLRTRNTPPNLIRRFLAEAKTAARLRHPNIVTVYDSGESDGHLFLALEYIDGPDVERLLRSEGPIAVERSLEIIRQIAMALDHASRSGVVHRDIKPSNILLRRDGTASLTDLGLARAIDETAASGITRAGFTVGTVDYMAPEQARSSKSADVRSDLYSLGCTWYHMLTGQVPYADGDLTNKLRAHAQSPPPDPRDVIPSIPAGIVAVVQRLMAKRPEERYATAATLLADLDKPGLCRETVTTDDLRGLALDAEVSEPRPSPVRPVWADDDTIPSGSTIVASSKPDRGEPVSRSPHRNASPAAAESRDPVAGRPRPPSDPASRAANRPTAPVRNTGAAASTSPPRRAQAPHRPQARRAPSNAAGKTTGRKPIRIADQTRAVVVLALVLAVLAVCGWSLSRLDHWFGGGVAPAPISPKAMPHSQTPSDSSETPPASDVRPAADAAPDDDALDPAVIDDSDFPSDVPGVESTPPVE